MTATRSPLHPSKAWPLYVGMVVAAGAAVVASVSTLAALADAAGWQGWTPWLLPASLDVGSAVGVWCWLRPGAPVAARRFGKWVALVSALGSLIGNAAGHLIESAYLATGPALIIVVGAVPAAVLVALAHLAVLLTTTDPIGPPDPGHPILTGPAPIPAPDRPADPAPDPITQPTRSVAPDPTRSDRPASTRSATRSDRARTTRSTGRPDPRTDDDLRIELAGLIDAGHLVNAAGKNAPAADVIRAKLHIHPARARALRDELEEAAARAGGAG